MAQNLKDIPHCSGHRVGAQHRAVPMGGGDGARAEPEGKPEPAVLRNGR